MRFKAIFRSSLETLGLHLEQKAKDIVKTPIASKDLLGGKNAMLDLKPLRQTRDKIIADKQSAEAL